MDSTPPMEGFQPGLVIQWAFNKDKRQKLHIRVFLKLGKFLVSRSLLQTHTDTLTGHRHLLLAHPHTPMSFSWGKNKENSSNDQHKMNL